MNIRIQHHLIEFHHETLWGPSLDYAAAACFEKMKKKIVVPVFWGPEMETTLTYGLDPVGPQKNGSRVKQ